MRWPVVVAGLILMWTTSTAIDSFGRGYEFLGMIYAAVPPIWLLTCAMAYRWLSGAALGRLRSIAAKTIVITLALVGTIFAHLAGSFASLGFSYGNGETQVAQAYLAFFGLGVAIALAPAIVLALLAMLFANSKRARLSAD